MCDLSRSNEIFSRLIGCLAKVAQLHLPLSTLHAVSYVLDEYIIGFEIPMKSLKLALVKEVYNFSHLNCNL